MPEPAPYCRGRSEVRAVVLRRAAAALAFAASEIAAEEPRAQPEAASGRVEREAVHAQRAMVVAAHPLAVDAGLEILRAGGGALDAALAAQWVLGLVEPQSSGIGGGGFLLHWSARASRLRSYDGRETAPQAAREERFLDDEGRPLAFSAAVVSGRAVGVPGLLRMLEMAHARHGRLAWRDAFAPAIRLAERGFPMSPRLHRLLERDPDLRADPSARALYYRADGRPRAVGEAIVNGPYGALLREIGARGADAFYAGSAARDIVRAVRSHPRPGDLALEDLRGYRALEREPVCGVYRERRICGAGPPSSGTLAVLQMLGILARSGFSRAAPGSAEALHLFAEAARLAYADRARYLADPAFVAVPLKGLLADDYLDARARLLGESALRGARAGEPRGAPAVAPSPEQPGSGTTHISIVDASGDAVALTSSIENAFGSRIMVRGFLLNNQLTDFAFRPGIDGRPVANRVQPGKRPRSSMTPLLVFSADGTLQMVLGSPGGTPIINYVAKTLVATLDWGLDVQAAVSLPNFGSTGGPTFIERGSAYESLAAALARRGHVLAIVPLTSGLHAIERVPKGDARLPSGGWRGGADPRREGVARGD